MLWKHQPAHRQRARNISRGRTSRMSSAGQPENNDVTRRQGAEVQVRHPAGGARLWQRLRAARTGRLPLSRSHRHVLAAVQNELQADAELAAAFSAFTSVTVGAAMPKIERLPAWRSLAGGGGVPTR